MKANHGRFIAGGLLLIAACTALAQDFGDARLLVAVPGTQGAYSRTALLVVPAGGGHVGLILNRSSDAKLAAVLPGNPQSANIAAPLRFGGPLGSKVIYAIVRGDPGEGAKRLFGDLFMTSGSKTIERIVEQMPEEARFFSGIAVWLPDELESQIEAGEWIVSAPDASMVFRGDLEAMWGELVARQAKTALK